MDQWMPGKMEVISNAVQSVSSQPKQVLPIYNNVDFLRPASMALSEIFNDYPRAETYLSFCHAIHK
jgi:ribosome biogenesis GTPase A